MDLFAYFIDWITGLLNFSAETNAERLTRQREYRNRIQVMKSDRLSEY